MMTLNNDPFCDKSHGNKFMRKTRLVTKSMHLHMALVNLINVACFPICQKNRLFLPCIFKDGHCSKLWYLISHYLHSSARFSGNYPKVGVVKISAD